MGVRKLVISVLLIWVMILAATPRSAAQVNTVNLSGTVLDPQNLAVKDAKLTLQNSAKRRLAGRYQRREWKIRIRGSASGNLFAHSRSTGLRNLDRYLLYPDARASRRIQPSIAIEDDGGVCERFSLAGSCRDDQDGRVHDGDAKSN